MAELTVMFAVAPLPVQDGGLATAQVNGTLE
jgi:hypothetical protein